MFARDLTQQIQKWLAEKEILILYGARQVGKTTLIEELFTNLGNSLLINCENPSVIEMLTDGFTRQLSNNPSVIIRTIDDTNVSKNVNILLTSYLLPAVTLSLSNF